MMLCSEHFRHRSRNHLRASLFQSRVHLPSLLYLNAEASEATTGLGELLQSLAGVGTL